MSVTFTIPTVEQAESGALSRLFQSRKWEKAALVWAFTTKDEAGRRTDLGGNSPRFPMPTKTFAAQGYSGLSDPQTVRHYRKAWQTAIDLGVASPVEPGNAVQEPELDWPPNAHPYLRTDGTEYEDSEDRAAAIQLLASSPELGGNAKGAIRAATSSPETLQVVAQTATAEQAKALAEGLRRRGIDQSEPYVQSLNAQQVREALEDPAIAEQVVADDSSRASVRKALDKRDTDAGYRLAERFSRPERAEVPGAEPFELLSEFRKLHIAMDRIVKLVLSGRAVVNDQERDALQREIQWLRAALDHTESGLTAHSLDEALRAFQEEWLWVPAIGSRTAPTGSTSS